MTVPGGKDVPVGRDRDALFGDGSACRVDDSVRAVQRPGTTALFARTVRGRFVFDTIPVLSVQVPGRAAVRPRRRLPAALSAYSLPAVSRFLLRSMHTRSGPPGPAEGRWIVSSWGHHLSKPLPVFERAGFVIGHFLGNDSVQVDSQIAAQVRDPDHSVRQFRGHAFGLFVAEGTAIFLPRPCRSRSTFSGCRIVPSPFPAAHLYQTMSRPARSSSRASDSSEWIKAIAVPRPVQGRVPEAVFHGVIVGAAHQVQLCYGTSLSVCGASSPQASQPGAACLANSSIIAPPPPRKCGDPVAGFRWLFAVASDRGVDYAVD